MSFESFNTIKNLDPEIISAEITKIKKNLFDLRLKKSTRQSFKPHEFKHQKRKIAQLLTIKSEKKQTIR